MLADFLMLTLASATLFTSLGWVARPARVVNPYWI